MYILTYSDEIHLLYFWFFFGSVSFPCDHCIQYLSTVFLILQVTLNDEERSYHYLHVVKFTTKNQYHA